MPNSLPPIQQRFTVQERAVRFQRRYTGPFRTVDREVGPVVVTYRYRRRIRIEWVEINVAGHDLWTHLIWRQTLVPLLLPIVKAIARVLA